MDEDNYPEQSSKGFSAGQMVVLFLAGVAVCAIFFTIGFVVGYNEKASSATPVAEKLDESSDVPPVVGQDSAKSSAGSRRADKSAAADASETLKPEPGTTSGDDDSAASTKAVSEPQMPTVLMPSKKGKAAAPPPETKPSEPSAPTLRSGIMIQVAATGTKPDAQKLVSALKTLSYPAVLLTPQEARATDSLYRVEVGPYPSRDAAEKIKQRLIQDGFRQPFIKH